MDKEGIMRREARCVLLMTLAVLLLFPASAAQKAAKVKYDPATETKISGSIEEVKEFQCPVSGTMGYHLALKTGAGVITVHVAASRFIKEYEIVFEKGQHIEVVGAKVMLEGAEGKEEAILAREIIRGQNTYTFRDKDGNPLW